MRKVFKKMQRGFSILELSLVLFIGAGLLATTMVVLQQFRQNQTYETYSALQAREMALIKVAASKYIKTQQATMTLGQRIEYGAADLIRGGFLPTDFALRDPGTGAQVGISPFGQLYSVVSIKDVLDKKVRTVIYDSGVPSPARLARVGVARVASSILSLKADIAGRGVSEQKTITGTVAAGALTATGYLNTFSNFNVSPWIVSAPSQAMTMVFLGFPELGDGTDPTGPTGPRYTNCLILDGSSTSFTDDGYNPPVCRAPSVEVKSWRVTTSFSLIDTPVGTLTTGSDVIQMGSTPRLPPCGGRDVIQPRPVYATFALTTLNNATALRQMDSFEGVFNEGACPVLTTSYYYRGTNKMCCEEVPVP